MRRANSRVRADAHWHCTQPRVTRAPLALRVGLCFLTAPPNTISDFMNWIDFIAIIPFYLELMLTHLLASPDPQFHRPAALYLMISHGGIFHPVVCFEGGRPARRRLKIECCALQDAGTEGLANFRLIRVRPHANTVCQRGNDWPHSACVICKLEEAWQDYVLSLDRVLWPGYPTCAGLAYYQNVEGGKDGTRELPSEHTRRSHAFFFQIWRAVGLAVPYPVDC